MFHKLAVLEDKLYEPTNVGGTLRNSKYLFIIKGALNWNKYLYCDCVYKGTMNTGQNVSFVLGVQQTVNYYSD